MSYIYEILSCVPAYARRWMHKALHERNLRPMRIQYGQLSHQSIVIYEPEGKPRPTTIAYMHGGAYVIGDPDSMGQMATMFTDRGYRFVSIGFSLMQERKFPAQIRDVFDGLACLVSYLDSHGFPSNRICLGGSSAGGHAAVTVAYGADLQRQSCFDASRITGCISLAGVMDIDDMLAKALWLGGGTARFVRMPECDRMNRARVHAALAPYSPIELIDGSLSIPFIAFHCPADKMSPYESERAFVDKLNANCGEGTATLHIMKGWSWQHMKLTVSLPIVKSPAADEARNHLFAWLGEIDSVQ